MKKLIALMAFLPILFVGCSKEGPADTPEGTFGGDAWCQSLGKTPKNRIPSYDKSKKDTTWPVDVWRSVGVATVDDDIIVTGDEADIILDISWPDTVFVAYTDLSDTSIRDTVVKPSPKFSGDLKFHYKVVDKRWKLVSLTPAAVRSDSAGNHVRLDSIKCEVLNRTSTYPTITNPAALMSCYPIGDYPYTFQEGDSIKVMVYAGDLDTNKVPLLFAPLKDRTPEFFNYEPEMGYWYGTWVVKNIGHHWTWISICDLDIILDRDMKAARSVLWGIPYRVE